MRVILFDRGDTLEHQGTLLSGAVTLLTAVHSLRDINGDPVASALVSDFGTAATAADIPRMRAQYLDGLRALGISRFFEPLPQRVTLSSDSTDPDFVKPSPRIFRVALDKLSTGLPFACAVFVTEALPHIEAARQLGMTGIHFRGPGQTTGQVARLVDLLPCFRRWLGV